MEENILDYIMVKPDGQAKIDKILKEIQESKLKFVGFYKVKDWFELSKKLYKEHYEKRGDDFAEDFESYVNVTNDLYGNSALIILLSDDILSNDEFIKKVYDLKYDIRKKYGRYINGEYVIIANSAKMSKERLKGKNINGYVKFQDDKGNLMSVKYLRDKGCYRCHYLDYVHCPDPNIINVQSELKLLFDEGILSVNNSVSKSQLKNIIKYRSFAELEDKEENEVEYDFI